MPRAIWKGAIAFGLVYIPVEIHSAARSSRLDLDLLDKRDFAPVGYQRVNKRTGKVVDWGSIVKGYQYRKGQYVALTDEDFRHANVKATQTIEISSFTEAENIPPQFFEQPYYLAPGKGGAKVYALLREALKRSGKIGVATFVMRGRQHLAAVLPNERALMLNTLRFSEELAPAKLELPPQGEKAAGLTQKEIDMAVRLVEEMAGPWTPEQYRNTYRKDLMERIEEKVRRHETHELTTEAPAAPRRSAEVIDLMDVLRRSLEDAGGERRPARRASSRSGNSRAKTKARSSARTRKRA